MLLRYKTAQELYKEFGKDWETALPYKNSYGEERKLTWKQCYDILLGLPAGYMPYSFLSKITQLFTECFSADDERYTNSRFDAFNKDIKKRVQLVHPGSGGSSYYGVYVYPSATAQIHNISAFGIVQDVTGNCQVQAIHNFANVLTVFKQPEIVQILQQVQNLGLSKRLFIFDINAEYDKYLAGFTVIFKQPYKSTNGSNMVMGLIKITQ